MSLSNAPSRDIRFPATLAIAWTLAGGLLLGGACVALMLFLQQMAAPLLLVAATVLFLVGAGFGFLHSLVLGYFGREKGTSWKDIRRSMLHGTLYFIPALVVGWMIAGWIAALPIALMTSVVGSIISIFSCIALAIILYFAITIGWDALVRAYGGWQDRFVGTIATLAVLMSLLVLVYMGHHPVWFVSLSLTSIGKLLLTLMLTFWVYGPIITLGLYLLHTQLNRTDLLAGRFPVEWKRIGFNVFHVFAVGLVLAILMLPFYRGVTGLPSVAEQFGLLAGFAASISEAISHELFLRLFLFTVVFWAAKKYLQTDKYSVLIAIVISMLADALFHRQEVASLGLPTFQMWMSYITVHTIIPSIAFGLLYWRRGLATAMGAHAMSGIFLGLLAL